MSTVASGLALFAALAVATALTRRARLLYRIVRLGKPTDRSGDLGRRTKAEATVVLGQRKLLQRIVPGLVHAFVFWGFIVLAPTIVMALLGAVASEWTLPWLGHQGWYFLLVDLFCVLVLVGVVSAFLIRKVQRPARFEGSHLREADLNLRADRPHRDDAASLARVADRARAERVARRLVTGVERAVGPLRRRSTTEALERVFVWLHVLTILGFLVYLPYSKHLHIATAGINVWFGRTRARGRLEPLDFEVEDEAALRLGSGSLVDMTWKQMLDTVSCTECGRCQDVCPAWATGKDLSPKLLIMGLRDRLFEEGPAVLGGGEATALVPGAVTDEVVWDCVTCGACVHECPVSIEHVDHIVDLRRHLVMSESRFPAEAGTMLRDVGRSSNPWGKAQSERAAWADGLDVRVLEPGDPAPEILYWVGCAASFDERARATARATATLLLRAGLDVAILGPRESCTGDPARRMGDEFTFQEQARQNVGTLGDAGVTRIVTSCPHCFNTLGNEYGDFGGDYEVVHHTELLAELLADGRLEAPAGEEAITYHDSCYLARHNDVLAAPREIVSRIGRPLEMARSGKRTFCCGAGGAHMWMEERGSAINEERAREAAATGADTLAVACPFCTMMLDDGVKQTGGELRVADVAVLLAESLERG